MGFLSVFSKVVRIAKPRSSTVQFISKPPVRQAVNVIGSHSDKQGTVSKIISVTHPTKTSVQDNVISKPQMNFNNSVVRTSNKITQPTQKTIRVSNQNVGNNVRTSVAVSEFGGNLRTFKPQFGSGQINLENAILIRPNNKIPYQTQKNIGNNIQLIVANDGLRDQTFGSVQQMIRQSDLKRLDVGGVPLGKVANLSSARNVREFKKGDILISSRGTIGKVRQFDEDTKIFEQFAEPINKRGSFQTLSGHAGGKTNSYKDTAFEIEKASFGFPDLDDIFKVGNYIDEGKIVTNADTFKINQLRGKQEELADTYNVLFKQNENNPQKLDQITKQFNRENFILEQQQRNLLGIDRGNRQFSDSFFDGATQTQKNKIMNLVKPKINTASELGVQDTASRGKNLASDSILRTLDDAKKTKIENILVNKVMNLDKQSIKYSGRDVGFDTRQVKSQLEQYINVDKTISASDKKLIAKLTNKDITAILVNKGNYHESTGKKLLSPQKTYSDEPINVYKDNVNLMMAQRKYQRNKVFRKGLTLDFDSIKASELGVQDTSARGGNLAKKISVKKQAKLDDLQAQIDERFRRTTHTSVLSEASELGVQDTASRGKNLINESYGGINARNALVVKPNRLEDSDIIRSHLKQLKGVDSGNSKSIDRLTLLNTEIKLDSGTVKLSEIAKIKKSATNVEVFNAGDLLVQRRFSALSSFEKVGDNFVRTDHGRTNIFQFDDKVVRKTRPEKLTTQGLGKPTSQPPPLFGFGMGQKPEPMIPFFMPQTKLSMVDELDQSSAVFKGLTPETKQSIVKFASKDNNREIGTKQFLVSLDSPMGAFMFKNAGTRLNTEQVAGLNQLVRSDIASQSLGRSRTFIEDTASRGGNLIGRQFGDVNTSNAFLIRPNEKLIDPQFFGYALENTVNQGGLKKFGGSGTAIDMLRKGDLESVELIGRSDLFGLPINPNIGEIATVKSARNVQNFQKGDVLVSNRGTFGRIFKFSEDQTSPLIRKASELGVQDTSAIGHRITKATTLGDTSESFTSAKGFRNLEGIQHTKQRNPKKGKEVYQIDYPKIPFDNKKSTTVTLSQIESIKKDQAIYQNYAKVGRMNNVSPYIVQYHTDPLFRKAKIIKNIERAEARKKVDSLFKEKKKAQEKDWFKNRYHNDPEFRKFRSNEKRKKIKQDQTSPLIRKASELGVQDTSARGVDLIRGVPAYPREELFSTQLFHGTTAENVKPLLKSQTPDFTKIGSGVGDDSTRAFFTSDSERYADRYTIPVRKEAGGNSIDTDSLDPFGEVLRVDIKKNAKVVYADNIKLDNDLVLNKKGKPVGLRKDPLEERRERIKIAKEQGFDVLIQKGGRKEQEYLILNPNIIKSIARKPKIGVASELGVQDTASRGGNIFTTKKVNLGRSQPDYLVQETPSINARTTETLFSEDLTDVGRFRLLKKIGMDNDDAKTFSQSSLKEISNDLYLDNPFTLGVQAGNEINFITPKISSLFGEAKVKNRTVLNNQPRIIRETPTGNQRTQIAKELNNPIFIENQKNIIQEGDTIIPKFNISKTNFGQTQNGKRKQFMDIFDISKTQKNDQGKPFASGFDELAFFEPKRIQRMRENRGRETFDDIFGF